MKLTHMRDRLEQTLRSRPARGAWIEIPELTTNYDEVIVAPREGRVD